MSAILTNVRFPFKLYIQHKLSRISVRSAGNFPGPEKYYQIELKTEDNVIPLEREPLSDQKKATLAAKWNLRPEDYKPMTNSYFNAGDYPDLPVETASERDPFYDWDEPYLKRNWGEPLFFMSDHYISVGNDTRAKIIDKPTLNKRRFLNVFLLVGLYLLCEYVIPYKFPVEAPIKLPEVFPADEIRSGVIGANEFEKRGLDPKVKSISQNISYTFDSKYKWDPSKYV